MSKPHNITNSELSDIPTIQNLYQIATDFQIEKFPGNVWPKFERSLIESEIRDNKQFKLVIDGVIACIWAITFNDPDIWEEKDGDPSIYIHRIATNPKLRGRQFVKIIVEWAKQFAEANNKKFIRLDTCGHNLKLISHYENCGFKFLGTKFLKDPSKLPKHYHGAEVCFFELAI